MPFPTDKAQAVRTFRKCAADPVGTVYHEVYYACAEGAARFAIHRGRSALECNLGFPTRAALDKALRDGPRLHGSLTSVPFGFSWTYDGFGDCTFEALRPGSYGARNVKEWGTQEVLEDCIDEVRRLLLIKTPQEALAQPSAPAPKPSPPTRRILTWNK